MKRRLTGAILLLLAWSAAVFGAGMLSERQRVLGQAYVTTTALELEPLGNHQLGRLPAGSPVYAYGGPDEQPLFVVFLGTKSLDSLQRVQPGHWLEITPVVAYPR